MYLIGLDIGTTGCKAALFTEDGTLVALARREYTVDMPHPGWAEQDAELVWRLAQEVMREITAGRQVTAAIGLAVQGEAIVAVDAQGRALRPAILGMDTRTAAQNDWLRDRLGARELFARTGMPIHTINTLPKLLWLRQYEPDVWHTAHQFLLYEDFLINKMTGLAVISECLASRTQLYDTRQGCWSPEILAAVGLDARRLAQVQQSGQIAGMMQGALSASLGFSKPPVIVTGGHDQACGALGVALVQAGQAMVSTGTAELVEVVLENLPALNTILYDGNISVYHHVVPGLYLAMTLNHSGGLLLRWFRDTLCGEAQAQARVEQRDAYEIILQDASPDPSPLLVLPHFAGSGTPNFDTLSKGAILGLTFATTRTDLAKALLEGLTFELRLNIDLLRAGGITMNELRAIGGGARSTLWTQLKADVTGIPVLVPDITEAACFGAALLAGQGAGCYKNAAQAAEAQIQVRRRLLPEAVRAARYTERYALYRQLYPALAPLLHQMSLA